MNSKPSLAFDTSALNRLVRDDDSEVIIAAILSSYEVLLPEMSIGELYATPDPEHRKKLFRVCRRLLGVGQCILPAHWILDALVQHHNADGSGFDWRRVPVRAPKIEQAVHDDDVLNDELLVIQQKSAVRKLQNNFEDMFERPRRRLEAAFDKGIERRPTNFRDYLRLMQTGGGQFWQFAQGLYDAAVNTMPDEDTIRGFIDICPPFRAVLYALALTWYDRCIRPPTEAKFSAGRNDQMMAVYLPYCDQFITAEKKGMQERCLRESAEAANISVTVRSYDDFCGSFWITR